MRAIMVRRVYGNSMVPQYQPGDVVFATAFVQRLKRGHVVIVRHAGLEKLKRVISVGSGGIWVEGDNQVESTDSRHFGHLTPDAVVGVVVCSISRHRAKRQ